METSTAFEKKAMRYRIQNRWMAGALHMAVSAIFAAGIAYIVFELWFPGEYREFSGGTDLFKIIAGVDFIVGPCLILTIFDKKKSLKALTFDILIISTIQLCALCYGVYMMSISRPVAIVLEEDRFRVISAMDVYKPELAKTAPEYRNLSFSGPRLLRSVLPVDLAARSDALNLALKGFDIGTRPTLWRPWDAAARTEALLHARPLSKLIMDHPAGRHSIMNSIKHIGQPIDDLVYIPMITFRGDWIAILKQSSGDLAGFAMVDGFDEKSTTQ